MPISAGSRLGPYEIVSQLGAGGMGEVYKSRDTRLGRDVAIKVLHASVSADDEARARFEREARTISQLNHPNICVLHDVGEQSGALFLVMEYIEGESLAARIARGAIPPEEAIEYAMQIADALDKAHRQGIVHRDLKPANVMLTKAGGARSAVTTTLSGSPIAKLLDFGLAKLAPAPSVGSLETVLASSPTAQSGMTRGKPTSPATAQGTILGTFQYMAPEQIEAANVDGRTDIWAFGCVLFEMLTGRRAFEGKTQASVIGAILERDPAPVTELQPLTPPALGRLVRICLAKDPDARFQSAYDLLLQLQWIAEGGSAVGLPAPVVARRKRRERALWLGAAAVTLALGAAGAWIMKPVPVVANVVERFSYALPDTQAFSRTGRRYVAISPNGKRMAYVADKKLHLRELDQLESHPIVGTNEDPLDPVFSPDGEWIAYFVPTNTPGFTLKKIQIGGGTPVPLCQTTWPYGISWRGHTIVFGQNSETVRGVQSVADTSGTPNTLVTVGASELVTQPHLTDDGGLVLFAVRANNSNSWDESDIVLQAPGATTRTVLVKGGTDARLVAGNRLVYYKAGTLFAIGFDPAARATRGGAVPIVNGVQATTVGSGAGVFDVAESGTLMFVPGGSESESMPRQLVWVDRQGKEERIPAPEQQYQHPRLSPDGKRIVVSVKTGSSARLYTWELERQVQTWLTPVGAYEAVSPLWTPDNLSVIYRSTNPDGASAIMRVNASGTREPELLLTLDKGDVSNGYPESLSLDGKALVFRRAVAGNYDELILPLDPPSSETKPRPLLAGPSSESNAQISPDGRWLAYAFTEPGTPGQLFVRPFPDVDANRWPASSTPGGDPLWARSSRELFYVSTTNKVMGVTVQPGPVFGRPIELFDNAPYMPLLNQGNDWDVSHDGLRFLMIKRGALGSDTTTRPTITVVTHWVDELKARVK